MKLVGTKAGVELLVHVQPRAGRSEVVGVHGDALRVRIAAPPVEGEANQELRRLLGKRLGLPPSSIEVLRGEQSRSKRLLLPGLTPQQVKDGLGL